MRTKLLNSYTLAIVKISPTFLAPSILFQVCEQCIQSFLFRTNSLASLFVYWASGDWSLDSFYYYYLILFIYFLCSRFLLVIYFIHISVHMSIPISQFITPPPHPPTTFPPWCPYVCSLHLCLYFCLANQFICIVFLDSTYELIYGICFSLSDLLHSVWQSLDPSTSLQMTQIRSFLWLSNICTTSSLYSFLSMGI